MYFDEHPECKEYNKSFPVVKDKNPVVCHPRLPPVRRLTDTSFIPDEIMQTYGQVEDRVFEEEFKDKFKLPDNLTEKLSYETMKRDLDVNHHVNNIAYLDIASEILSDDLLQDATEIAVVYKKEITYKDIITCYCQDDTVYLYNKEKNILNGIVKIK